MSSLVCESLSAGWRRWTSVRGLPIAGMAVAAAVCALCAAQASAQTRVDLELVIAVDVSRSMDNDEQRLQRAGYVAALRDPEVQSAITAGAYGRITTAYLEWAGPDWQNVVIPWTVIDSPAAARAFADRLEAQPISRERLTSIGAALGFAGIMLSKSGFSGLRRVVDVSGDGPNNAGPPVLGARNALVTDGIIVNGLPIMLKAASPGFLDLPDLDDYYAACVIGGPGAFMVPVKAVGELKSAIRRKLLLEISGLPPRVIPAQDADWEGYDCLVGEKQWRWFLEVEPN